MNLALNNAVSNSILEDKTVNSDYETYSVLSDSNSPLDTSSFNNPIVENRNNNVTSVQVQFYLDSLNKDFNMLDAFHIVKKSFFEI